MKTSLPLSAGKLLLGTALGMTLGLAGQAPRVLAQTAAGPAAGPGTPAAPPIASPAVPPEKVAPAAPAPSATAPDAARTPDAMPGTPSAPPAAPSAPRPPAHTPEGQRLQKGVEKRISSLHARLKIAPPQQAQWDDFAETMRQNAQNADQVFEQMQPPQAQTALDSMRVYAKITETHAQDVARLLPKFEALYGALSPAQRKAADETFADYQRQMMKGGRPD